VCPSTVHPAFEQRRFVTVASICNLRRHFFVFSGSVLRCHSCLLWRLLQ
jgi:hypothetical protein